MSVTGSRTETVSRPVREPGDGAPDLAFIVPAFNEARFIGATLESVHHVVAGRYRYEIIVVDNGSTDGTAAIAREHGARVFVRPGSTIADLRNFGASQCSAAVLVFVDADVSLTAAWGANIGTTLREFSARPRLLTGSWCGVPPDASWIERYWFGPKAGGGNGHINSGHLLIARAFFEELGGFDAALQTGEDYELSVRALAARAEMVEEPALAVVHRGYPRTLGAFVRREVWHGRSDFVSLGTALRSRVALVTFLFIAFHGALLSAIIARSAALAGGAVLAIAALCLALSLRQFRRHGWSVVAVNTFIYYAYLAGRSLAFVRARFRRDTFVPRDRR